MDDPQAPPEGTRGTVLAVDDIASLIVAWDNGSSLNVAYGVSGCTTTEIKMINDIAKVYLIPINGN